VQTQKPKIGERPSRIWPASSARRQKEADYPSKAGALVFTCIVNLPVINMCPV
jgi:hypothetical protein